MGLSSKQVSVDIHYWPQGGLNFPKPEKPNDQKQNTPLLQCPRCESTNTKFCYYNNYNRSQPRHFCRSCRRHWTAGGALRNIPIGGGRKNKRRKITAPSFAENPAAPIIGEMKVAIFPNILQQAQLHYPPPESSLFGASFSNTCQTFMEDFGLASPGSGWGMQFPASYWDFLDGGGDEFVDGDAVVENVFPQ